MTEPRKRPDCAEHDRLEAEQKELAVFIPYMTHSFGEDARFVLFHAQILADFNTIEELGRKILEELDRWFSLGLIGRAQASAAACRG